MNMKHIQSFALALALAGGCPLQTFAEDGSYYTVTIPEELAVQDSGWNETAGITVSEGNQSFPGDKRLSVTVESENNWQLTDGSGNTVGYTLKPSENGVSDWLFTADEVKSGTTKGLRMLVDDSSSLPPGTYTDNVKFTVKTQYVITGTTYAIDFPGFGKSDEPDSSYTVEDYAKLTLEFIEKNNISDLIYYQENMV